MLSPFDEYPIHQTAEPIRHVATSDRNFYDRYYFNCHPCSDDMFLIFGLGVYPNLGTMDFYAVVRKGNLHRVVRGSQPITDRSDPTVGPFSIEVIDGLHTLRCKLDDNEHGLSFDLTWNGACEAFAEEHHQDRRHGRMIIDTMRFAQTGTWTGSITVGDDTTEVTPDHWWGNRDRSWGVRPIGEPEPPGIQADGFEAGILWNYAPMQFEDHTILYMCQERSDGSRVLESGVRVWHDADKPIEQLGRPEHKHEIVPGTRTVKRSTLSFPHAQGGRIDVEATPILPLTLGVGTGYGFDADWRHGMYHGKELVVQGLDLDYVEDSEKLWGLVDSVATYEYNGPSGPIKGFGLFEWIFIGDYPAYGLTGFLDGAPA